MAVKALQSKFNEALVQNAAGDYAVRTLMAGDQDLEGGYISNEQTTTNMMSKGTVYRFDGDNDLITVSDSAEIQNIFTAGGFVSADIYPLSDGESNIGYVVSKWASGVGWILNVQGEVGGYVALRFRREGSTDGLWVTSVSVPINTQSNVMISFDDSTPSTAPVIYLNGVALTIASATACVAPLTDVGQNLVIGNRDSAASTFDGEIGEVMLGNFIPAAAEILDLISGNIPFKWQYGSQVGLVTGDDSDFDTDTGNWLDWSGGVFNGVVGDWAGAGGTGIGKMTLDTGSLSGININAGLTKGQRYLVSIEAKLLSGASVEMFAGSDLAGLTFTPTGTETVFSGEFTSTSTALFVGVAGATAGQVILIDDVTLIALGAVALYDNTSISDAVWYDKANGNDGAVTGAEVLNPPSVTPLLAMHTNTLRLEPGGTPGTNINCTDRDSINWGQEAVTDATNLAKSGSSGSFALDAAGDTLTLTLNKSVVGIMGYGIRKQDVNNSSTSELYTLSATVTSEAIEMGFFKRGSGTFADLTSILQAGDQLDFWVSYVTAT
jgi:hypothetical protein